MKLKPDVVSEDLVQGFVKVEKFSGHVTRINTAELQGLIELLKLLSKAGIKSVEVGVESREPVVVFTTKDRSHGYAIAGYCPEEAEGIEEWKKK